MVLKAMREQRAKMVADMRAIITKAEAETRELSAEEQKAFDDQQVAADGLSANIERLEKLEGAEAALTAVQPAAARGNGTVHRAGGAEAKRAFCSLGEFMCAVRFNQNDPRLEFVELDASGETRAEMRMDDGPSGGFAIPPQFLPEIRSVEPQEALVRPLADVIPAGNTPDAPIQMPALDQTGSSGQMYGGIQVQWIGEGDTKPDTGAKLRNITLTPHEVAGTITVTDKLLRNWPAAATFFDKKFRDAVNGAEDYAFIRGDGVAKPLGALSAPATYWVNRAVANQISYPDLVAMVSRVLMRSASPVWSMPQSVLPQIALMTDPEGHYIWTPNNGTLALQTGYAGYLLGYPVRWNNRMPLLGTKGDVLLADWSQYVIKDGFGPFVAASEHVLFQQNKTMVKIFWNVDGAPWLTAPIQEENGWQVSPFVGLDVPA